jgi:hypothetical protein
MSKFLENLTRNASGIKEARAKMVSSTAAAAQQDLIRELEKEELALNTTIMNLEDLYPSTSFSLDATKEGFNAERWVAEMQEAKVELANKQIELQIARGTFNEFFLDEPKV